MIIYALHAICRAINRTRATLKARVTPPLSDYTNVQLSNQSEQPISACIIHCRSIGESRAELNRAVPRLATQNAWQICSRLGAKMFPTGYQVWHRHRLDDRKQKRAKNYAKTSRKDREGSERLQYTRWTRDYLGSCIK